MFAEPWQAEAFAMTVALHERGLFSWGEWAAALSVGGEEIQMPQPTAATITTAGCARWRTCWPPRASPRRGMSTGWPTPGSVQRMPRRTVEPILLENDPEGQLAS